MTRASTRVGSSGIWRCIRSDRSPPAGIGSANSRRASSRVLMLPLSRRLPRRGSFFGHRRHASRSSIIIFTLRWHRPRSVRWQATAERARHLKALGDHHRHLQELALNCPENFENRAALVGAEIARVEGRALDALNLRASHPFSSGKRLCSQRGARQRACRTVYAARGFEIAAMAICETLVTAISAGELTARYGNSTRRIRASERKGPLPLRRARSRRPSSTSTSRP